ncbi:hypothetical protein FACS1894102_0930 [Spirochaetia bacterium]|nr:hypothetical protein FACS1894102_0930 [Spirochaetia bacterium]
MKKTINFILAICVLVFLFTACTQDPIFYNTSKAVAPVDPIIQGSPSKPVKTTADSDGNFDIYTSNGKLWKFSGNSWAAQGSPGKVFDVAIVGNDDIYILVLDDSTTSVYTADLSVTDIAWTAVSNSSSYSQIQSLYGVGGKLFAGARGASSDNWAILKLDAGDFVILSDEKTGNLSGVAHNGTDYFFTTKPTTTAAAAIYHSSSSLTTPSKLGDGDGNYAYAATGIFSDPAIGANVIAVTSIGQILEITASAIKVHTPRLGSYLYPYTGAIAVWQKQTDPDKKRLLIGVNGGTDDYGYFEMEINGTTPAWDALNLPGKLRPDSSIDDYASYSQQLQKHALRSLITAPPSAGASSTNLPVVFAATQKSGLWSYRRTDDYPAGVWNAE